MCFGFDESAGFPGPTRRNSQLPRPTPLTKGNPDMSLFWHCSASCYPRCSGVPSDQPVQAVQRPEGTPPKKLLISVTDRIHIREVYRIKRRQRHEDFI